MEEITIERKSIPKNLTNKELIDLRIKYLNNLIELRKGIVKKIDIYKKSYQDYKAVLREVQSMQRKLEDIQDRLVEIFDRLK